MVPPKGRLRKGIISETKEMAVPKAKSMAEVTSFFVLFSRIGKNTP